MELDVLKELIEWVLATFPNAGPWVIGILAILGLVSVVFSLIVKLFNLQPGTKLMSIVAAFIELFSWAQTRDNKEVLTKAKKVHKDVENDS